MSVGWSKLTFTPDSHALDALANAWAWRLQTPFQPVLFSAVGDMFFARDDGSVWWLNTGTAEVTHVASSVDHFREQLGTELADEWMLPDLVAGLHEAGKIPEPGECYTYVTLPIFAEGKYEVDNLNPVPAHEHFGLTGNIHQQIAGLPDGTQVKVQVAD